MRKLLVFQHVAFEILGTLNPLFKKDKFKIKYVNFGRHPNSHPDLKGYHGLVILGGPMGVNDVEQYHHIKTEIALIQKAVDKGIPILGICLGAQLIAAALGGKVQRNPIPEIGWYDVSLTAAGKDDPLFQHFRDTEKIFQWHNDTFAIPDGAVHLATTTTCPNQAFRYNHNIYGLQFHLEVDEPLIERWLTTPVHVEELAKLEQKISLDKIREENHIYIEQAKLLSNRTFSEFLKFF